MHSHTQIQESITKLKIRLNLPAIIYAELSRVGSKYMSGASLYEDEVEILDMVLLLATEPS